MNIKVLSLKLILILIICHSGALSQTNAVDTSISVNPRATFLRVNNDPGNLSAVPVSLQSLGIAGGDLLLMQSEGDFDNGPGGDIYNEMFAVFSSDDTLLDPSQLHRVPGAIDAGDDYITPATYSGNLPTDIPEDFQIDSTIIQVPDSARFLFISVRDNKFGDNSDPDNDLKVRFTKPVTNIGNISSNQLADYRLYQNYPNPFNPATNIEFRISKPGFVTLKVYNVLGEKVDALVSAYLLSGSYQYQWDASGMPSGVYLYRLEVEGFVIMRQMILVR